MTDARLEAAQLRLWELESQCRMSARETAEARHLQKLLSEGAGKCEPCKHGTYAMCAICKTDTEGGRAPR